MNFIKRGIFALMVAGLVTSCIDDGFQKIEPAASSGGTTDLVFSSFSVSMGGDGTIVTVTPISVGADSYTVDFGDGSSPVTTPQGTPTTHDYANINASTDYTITVTATGGGASASQSEDITVNHSVQSVESAASTPSGKRYNIFNIFTESSYPVGTGVSGGNLVAQDSGNEIIEFSRLHSENGELEMGDEVVVADAFASGVGVSTIHFDVHSNFDSGVNKLKITLVDTTNAISHVIDDLDLTDGEWTSFDFDLATDFSPSPVAQFHTILFETGSTGTANDHATISVDNIYMPRMTGSTIINGDFEDGQDFWKWGTFTDGETNPFGSSSDGSDFDIDGNDTGGKTRGAKWSSSQSGGEFRSSSSRYAYQELVLTPGASYMLEYQYAIKDDSGTDPIGGRHVVGLILDGQYDDGADAVENIGDNLGYHQGFIAEGKFSDTTNDFGTLVQIPFTANESGEVAIMFYAVTPKDAYVDNVKVIAL